MIVLVNKFLIILFGDIRD